MTDSFVPDERSHSLERYEQMSYAQLSRFIHDAVDSLSKPSASRNEAFPSSQEELSALCDMLRAKADALKDRTPAPRGPTYDGPSNPGYFFTPSDELDGLYREQRRAERRVEYETKHGDSDIYLEYIRDELKKIERKVVPVEQREQQEHEERLKEYREAYEPYRQRLRSWQTKVEKVEKRLEAEAARDEAVQRTYRKVKRAFEPRLTSTTGRISTLPWEIAAPGERADNHSVYEYYREVLSQGRLDGFDQERLDKVLALPRSGLLKGKSRFYGYIVLRFAHTEKVLMECPVYANAIYVLNSGEERLLRMNKQELIASGEARRIFHTGNWYRRVKQELEIE